MSEQEILSQEIPPLSAAEIKQLQFSSYLEKAAIIREIATRAKDNALTVGSSLLLTAAMILSQSGDSIAHAQGSRIFLPNVNNGLDEKDRDPAQTAVPIKTSIPTRTNTAVPTGTSTPEATGTSTPEIEKNINFHPQDRVWDHGPAHPYNPSGSFASEGVNPAIPADTEASGWVDNSRQKAHRLFTAAGDRLEVLAETLIARVNPEELPPAEDIADGDQERIQRVIADKLQFHHPSSRYGGEADEEEPLISHSDQLHPFYGNSEPPLAGERQQEVNDDPQEALLDREVQESLESKGMTPMPNLPESSSGQYFWTGFGSSSSTELIPGKGASFEITINTNDYAAVRLGQRNIGDGSKVANAFAFCIKGREVSFVSLHGNPEAKPKVFSLDVNPTDGELKISAELASDRKTVNFTVTDNDGIKMPFSYVLPYPLSRNHIDADVFLDLEERDEASGSYTVSIDGDADETADWVEGRDSNLERKGQLTDQRQPLHQRLNHKGIAMPYMDGGQIGANIPDAQDLYSNGNHVLVRRSTHRSFITDAPKGYGAEFWQVRDSVNKLRPYRDGAIRALVQARQAAGDIDFRAIQMYDLRSSTIDEVQNATTAEMDEFTRGWLDSFDPGLFIDAPIVVSPDGRISAPAARISAGVGVEEIDSVDSANELQSAANDAKKYAEGIMARLGEDGEYHGVWAVDPKMSLGLTQTETLKASLKAANGVEGFTVDQVVLIIQGPQDMILLEGFIRNMNEDDIMVGLIDADSHIPASVASALTKNQLGDDRDAICSIFDPIDPDRAYNPDTVLLNINTDGEPSYTPAFNELGAGF